MYYIAHTEKRMEESQLGLDISFKGTGQHIKQQIPGVIYLDDIHLLANMERRRRT